MRAGALDRTIVIQSAGSASIDAAGTPSSAWSDFATVRAQLVEASTEEYLRGYGEGAQGVAIFRIRYLEGVVPEQRVQFDGRAYNVREVKQIGRRRGLELRTEEVRP